MGSYWGGCPFLDPLGGLGIGSRVVVLGFRRNGKQNGNYGWEDYGVQARHPKGLGFRI